MNKTIRPPRPGSVPVSVLIPTKNEIGHMRECLESVAFASEIVVVDSHSTDGSVDVALDFGATVIPFKWDGEYPKKKNWALANVQWKNEWVLIVDADERITPELAREISRRLRAGETRDGYYINRRFMFLGDWIRYCGYYPSWNMRLFKHAKGRYEILTEKPDPFSGDNEVHEHIVLDGEAGRCRHDMLHFAYPSVFIWVEKHNRYSNWEATLLEEQQARAGSSLKASPFGGPLERKRWLKQMARRMPSKPLLRFAYHYLYKQGFRDGYRGLIFCQLLAWYEFLSGVKSYEARMAAKNLKP